MSGGPPGGLQLRNELGNRETGALQLVVVASSQSRGSEQQQQEGVTGVVVPDPVIPSWFQNNIAHFSPSEQQTIGFCFHPNAHV